MAMQVDKKFTWVIKNFSSLQSKKIYSDPFVIGDCKWRISAHPKGDVDDNNDGNEDDNDDDNDDDNEDDSDDDNEDGDNDNNDYLSLYLEVADSESMPSGWKRYANYRLTIVNQLSSQRNVLQETDHWFDKNSFGFGFPWMIPLAELHDGKEEFLVNGELTIVAEVDVLEVIGTLDTSEKSKEASNPLKKRKLNDDDGVKSNDTLKETSSVKESIDVNGFQVLPSQVESVKSILERHPDIASKSCPKNRHLKSTYMNVLLGIIETLCQLPEELSDDDLDEASAAVSYVTKGGFKVDLLEKKLEELKEKKKIVDSGNARKQQLKEELQKCNQKCLDLQALLEKHNAEVLGANVRFSFDDVV